MTSNPTRSAPEAEPEAASWKASRVGVYALAAGSAGAVPLPWLPDALLHSVRGALVRDLAARRGVALDPAARSVLAACTGEELGVVRRALRFMGARLALRTMPALGPARLARPLNQAVHVYVLGRLFDRHLAGRPPGTSDPLDAAEAQRVRAAIDGALMHALVVHVDPLPEPPEFADGRSTVTAAVDRLLAQAADLPERFVRRLDASFDDLMAHERS